MKKIFLLSTLLLMCFANLLASTISPKEKIQTRDAGISEWTYMLYLYEDGTGLDGNKDLNEWEELGSIPGVINYIALYDCDDDSKDGIYYISKDFDGYNTRLVSERISMEFNGGLDMNDAETLKNFILWVKEYYPAKHYGCNVWDHGNGIFKSKKQEWKAACGDMTVWDLANSLKAFKEVDGKGFDIFGFDVCLLGQVETVHALKNYTDVVIASEKTEPGDGWHYRTQFQILNDNPEVDVYEFASDIVIKYDESYDGGIQGRSATTQTAIRTDYYKADFVPALNSFVEGIIPELYEYNYLVKDARNTAWYSDGIDYIEHRDLGHFLSLLSDEDVFSQLTKDKIDNLLAAYEKCIVKTAQNQCPNATGLKIWIPNDISENHNKMYYLNADRYLDISETKWDEFLEVFENPVTVGEPRASFYSNSELSGRINMVADFIDQSNCKPSILEREWEFSPNTVEFVDCKQTDKEIQVRFLEAGNYSVTLSVTNAEGVGALTKENFVQVRDLAFPAPDKLSHNLVGNDVSLTWNDNWNSSRNESTILHEGFEGEWLPRDWQIKRSLDIDGEFIEPSSGPDNWVHSNRDTGVDYIYKGDYSAFIDYGAKDFNWLITPEIKIERYNKLNFWLWYSDGEFDDYHTSFRVMINVEDEWEQLLYYYAAESNKFDNAVEIDLAKYEGKNVKIAFVQEYTDGWELAIDEVMIYREAPEGAPDGSFDHYNVYRNKEKIAETESQSYTDTSDGVGEFSYYVTAVYSNLEGESQPSNEIKVRFGEIIGDSPSNLIAQLTESDLSVSLTWEEGPEANADLESYKVYRNDAIIATLTTANYTDQLEKTTANYIYKVIAVYGNGIGETDASNEESIMVQMTGSVPTNLNTQLNEEDLSVSLRWEEGLGANADIELYNVYCNDALIGTSTTENYTDGREKTSANYVYKVTAVYGSEVGETDASNEQAVSVVITGVNELGLTKLNVYPNPSNGDFKLSTQNYRGAKWVLYDMQGKIIKLGVVEENNTAIHVDISGIYILHIGFKGQTIVKKVIIQ